MIARIVVGLGVWAIGSIVLGMAIGTVIRRAERMTITPKRQS